MPLPYRQPPPGTTVTGDKRRLVYIAVAVAAFLAVVGAWSAIRPGSYGQSRDGCVTVTIPSSTGGGLLHECGGKARALCVHAFRSDGKIALLTRPQCRQAGLD